MYAIMRGNNFFLSSTFKTKLCQQMFEDFYVRLHIDLYISV